MALSEEHARDSHHTQHHTQSAKCCRQPQRYGPAFKGAASELPRDHAQSINPLIAPEVPARPMAHFGKLLLGGCEQRPSKRAKPPHPAARPPGLPIFPPGSQVCLPVPLPSAHSRLLPLPYLVEDQPAGLVDDKQVVQHPLRARAPATPPVSKCALCLRAACLGRGARAAPAACCAARLRRRTGGRAPLGALLSSLSLCRRLPARLPGLPT